LKTKIVIFADLDGTILDDNYSYKEVQPVLRKLVSMDVSIVIDSSKTRAEIEYYLKKLRLNEPFIVENGSAIFIPKGYFSFPYEFVKETQLYQVIELGVNYSSIRNKLEIVRKKSKATIIGFGDMTVKEVAIDAGLSIDLAILSKKREYDEPFKIVAGCEAEVLLAIEKEQLCYTRGGRYFHLLGKTDKGNALVHLKQLYLKKFQHIVTIGIGDGPNDKTMLKLVDNPIWINNNSLIGWREILEIAKQYTQTRKTT
jgi:mannosyl-3-phosphoglycerate phosphatase